MPERCPCWPQSMSEPAANIQKRFNMASLFDGTEGMEDIGKIYDQMEANCPHPRSNSKRLWELRRAPDIGPDNTSPETMIEKAVAILAEKGHLLRWFNQCSVASGIGDSFRNRKSNVDLVHWSELYRQVRLVELKWASDDPLSALRQILRYGAAYLFCRVHKKELPIQAHYLMNVPRVALEVVAPAHYYRDYNLHDDIARMRHSLDKFMVGSKISGLSMSLNALVFPEEFNQVPFKDGGDVKLKCNSDKLTDEGRKVRDTFDNLAPAWPVQ